MRKSSSLKTALALAASIIPGTRLFATPEKPAEPQKQEYDSTMGLQYSKPSDMFDNPGINLRLLKGADRGGDFTGDISNYSGTLGADSLPELSLNLRNADFTRQEISGETDGIDTYTTITDGIRKQALKSAGIGYNSPFGRFEIIGSRSKAENRDRIFDYDSTFPLPLPTMENTLFTDAKTDSLVIAYSSDTLKIVLGEMKRKQQRQINAHQRIDTGLGILEIPDSYEENSRLTERFASADYKLLEYLTAGLDLFILDSKKDSTRLFHDFSIGSDVTIQDTTNKKPFMGRARITMLPEDFFAGASASVGYTTSNLDGKAVPIGDTTLSLNAGDFGISGTAGRDTRNKIYLMPMIYLMDKKEIHSLARFVADQGDILEDPAANIQNLESRVRSIKPGFVLGAQLYESQDSKDLKAPDKSIKHLKPFFALDIARVYRLSLAADAVLDKEQAGTHASAITSLDIAGILGLPFRLEAYGGAEAELRQAMDSERNSTPAVHKRATVFGLCGGVSF